jgi:hypothetical protein
MRVCLRDGAAVGFSGGSFSEAVALAAQGHDVGVVDEAVDQRGGDHGVGEDFAPGLKAAVAGDDDRAAFVAAGDQREEQVGGLAFQRQVADLVDLCGYPHRHRSTTSSA